MSFDGSTFNVLLQAWFARLAGSWAMVDERILKVVDELQSGYDREVRELAAKIPRTGDVLPMLLEVLQLKDEMASTQVVRLVGELKDRRAIPALIQVIQYEHRQKAYDEWIAERRAAGETRILWLAAERIEPEIIGLRQDAMQVLVKLEAREAIPHLVKIAREEDDMRHTAWCRAAELGAEEAIPYFIDRFKPVRYYENEPFTLNSRKNAARLLAKFDTPEAKAAVAAWRAAHPDED